MINERITPAERKIALGMRSRGTSFAKIGREIGLTGRDVCTWFNAVGHKLKQETIEDGAEGEYLDTAESYNDPGDDEAGETAVDELVKGLSKNESQATAHFIDHYMTPQQRASALVSLARQKKNPNVALASLKLITALKAEDKGKPPPPAPLFALPHDAFPGMGGKVPS